MRASRADEPVVLVRTNSDPVERLMLPCTLLLYTCRMALATNKTVWDVMPPEEAPVSKSSVPPQRASAEGLTISGSVDYLIWTIETAALEHDVVEARSILAQAIDSYAAAVNNRVDASTCRGIQHRRQHRVRMPPFTDV
jgi:hypothetical protein